MEGTEPLNRYCLEATKAANLVNTQQLDERQITHPICARLKYDLYDFFRGCFGAFYTRKTKHPLKSHIDHILSGHRLDE